MSKVTAKQLSAFIDQILKHEDGLAILLGTVPPPIAADLCELKKGSVPDLGVRVDGGTKTPYAEAVLLSTEKESRIIREIGGWKRINRAMREYKNSYPQGWSLFEEHVLFVRQGGMIHDGNGGMSAVIAAKHGGITTRTLRNRRNAILNTVSRYVLSWMPGDDFKLIQSCK